MARKAVYRLVTKNGPSADEQLALIRKTVKLTRQDEIYTDDVSEKYRRKDAPLTDRAVALKQLRAGDVLVVATPGCLGIGRDDIRGVLMQLSRGGHAVIDASSGKMVRWTEEVADAVEFLDRAILERRQKAAATAREVQMALGRTYIPEEKPLAISKEQVELMWYDRVRYPSRKAIAEMAGVSDRTLHTRFGPRTGQKRRRRK